MNSGAAQTAPATDRYRAMFAALAHADDALTDLRRAALARFISMGFPTQRDEAWKYTSLRRLQARDFELPAAAPAAFAADEVNALELDGLRIVLVDGHVMPGLSTLAAQPPGVTLLTLAQWAKNDAGQVAQFLRVRQGEQDSALEHLNTAFFRDGLILEISAGAQIDLPVHILHHWSRHTRPRMSHPRIVICAGAGSRVSVVEHYAGYGRGGHDEGEHFTNAVTIVEVGAGAEVAHYRLQNESPRAYHMGSTRVRVQKDGRYSSYDIAVGGAIGRLGLTAWLEGPGAGVTLHGLLVPGGTQHLDTCTRIEHAAPHTTSHEEYRGIAAGRGRGVFNGKVVVHPDAQHIDARQSSRNLLLSDTAEIDTRPELEIYANDVKCSHGATTGQLDPAALFYLRSRGLSERDARNVLIRAFAETILTTLPYPAMRHYLERQLEEQFSASGAMQS